MPKSKPKRSTRILPPTKELFRRSEDIPKFKLTKVEGGAFKDLPSLKVMMVTEDMECLKVYRKKGFVDPKHTHEDHSTVACLLYGKVRLHIGEQTFLAGPGDVWMHPQGVPHYTEALEDCCQIEVKAPACKTW
jgi:mannose-6-phosphate isomerase-like protein (cupin superfamily)